MLDASGGVPGMGEEGGEQETVRQWSTREIRYLKEHAGDGAKEIAKALGRTTEAVKLQARKCGICLLYTSPSPRDTR